MAKGSGERIEFDIEVKNAQAIRAFEEVAKAVKKIKFDPNSSEGVKNLEIALGVAAKRILEDVKSIQKALSDPKTSDSIRKWGYQALSSLEEGRISGKGGYKEARSYLRGLNTKGKDVSGVSLQIEQLATDYEKLNETLNSINSSETEATQGAEQFAGTVEESGQSVQSVLEQIDRAFEAVSGKVEETSETIQNAIPKDLIDSPIDLNTDVTKMNILELSQYLTDLQNRIAQLKDAGATGRGGTILDDELQRTVEAANRASNQISVIGQKMRRALSIASQGVRMLQNAINGVIAFFKRLGSVAINAAKKIWSVFKGIGSKIGSFFGKIYRSISKDADKAFSSRNLKKTLTMLTKYIFGVRSFFFLYRKLRKLISEGLENLVQFESATNETNHAITELRTSLLFIKNAWAAAFAPIINVVYPILVGLMDMLAAVGNAIARFIAALTGQATVLQAVRVSAGDYADSLAQAGGAAGKAADEQDKLNKKLAAFDDLNVLGIDEDTDPNKGGGGGGGGADDLLNPNTMFERISTPMTDLVKLIQEAWETGNAFRLGEFFATRLSESLDKAYEWLTGEGRAKVMKIGGLIASFIDGWLSVDDLGTKFGTVIGEAFVLAMDFINIIITPNRMLKIGTQIADAFNSAIPLILPKLGETMGNLFKSAISGAWGFLTTADFKSWGEAISSAFNNFINEMNQDVTITTAKGNLEWGGKVENTGLNGWEMLGQNVTMIAQGMLDMLGEAIGGADWSGLGKGIGTAIENIDVEAIKDSLKKLADKISSALQELWGGFKEGNPEGSSSIEGLFKGAIDMLPGLIALGATIGVIAGGLKLISTAITIIAPIASVLLPMLSTTGLSGLTGIAGALASIAPSLVIVAGVIGGFVETLFAAAQGFEDGEKGTMSFGGALINGIGGAIPIVVYWINYLWGKLGLLSDKFEAVKLIVISVLSSISEKFAIVFLAARTLWITFKGTITRGIEALQTAFEGFGAMISAIFSGDIRSALNIAIGAIESFLNTCLQGIADFANSPALGGIASLAGRTVSSVASTTITLPRIPALAQGAVIPPNNQFLAVLGDQTSGTNIEAPLDTIQQAVGAELAPYLQELIAVNRQVIQAINAKPVISKNDIGKANAQYVAQQKIIRGTML